MLPQVLLRTVWLQGVCGVLVLEGGLRSQRQDLPCGGLMVRVMFLINLAHVASRWNLGCGVDSIMLAGKCKRLIELCVPGVGWQPHTAHPQEGGIRKASGAEGTYECTRAT